MSKDQTWVKLEPWLQPQHANNVPKLVAFTGQKMPLRVGFQQTCSCTNAEVICISACLCCMDFCLFVCLFLAEMDSDIVRSRWTDYSHQSRRGAGREGLVRLLQSQTLPHSRPLRAIRRKHNNKQTLVTYHVDRCLSAAVAGSWFDWDLTDSNTLLFLWKSDSAFSTHILFTLILNAKQFTWSMSRIIAMKTHSSKTWQVLISRSKESTLRNTIASFRRELCSHTRKEETARWLSSHSWVIISEVAGSCP